MNRRPTNARDAAEAAFRRATLPERATEAAKVPGSRENVTLRLDSDVLEHFQAEGPGWQDRMNAALRRAAGL